MTPWDGIDEFVAVATVGSFAGGAKLLRLSTTHMSRAVARLENRVQAQLFHRTTRNVRLTDAGITFLEQCRQLIVDRDEAVALISERGEPQGELRLTCSTALGERFVAPMILAHAAQYQNLRAEIELTNRVIDIVAEGYDLAIRTGSIADARLAGEQVASRRLFTCASPDYLARHSPPRQIVDLAAHNCLVGSSATWHFTLRGQEALYHPKGRWRCNSGTALLNAALAGMGICQLPEFYVLPHINSGALVLVLDDVRAQDEPIWAVFPRRRHLLPKVGSMIDCLRQRLGPAMSGDSMALP